MIGWYMEQTFWLCAFLVLLAAVVWETLHLIYWVDLLGSEDPAQLLRQHAYTYLKWFLGGGK